MSLLALHESYGLIVNGTLLRSSTSFLLSRRVLFNIPQSAFRIFMYKTFFPLHLQSHTFDTLEVQLLPLTPLVILLEAWLYLHQHHHVERPLASQLLPHLIPHEP